MKKINLIIILTVVLIQFSIVSALTIDSVTITPEEIEPGDLVNIKLIIENNLKNDAENVKVVLDLDSDVLPFAPYQSSNEVLIEDIDEGDEEGARFKLIVFSDAKTGTYKIPVTITYFLAGNETETKGLISLIVAAEPKLIVSEENSLLIRGEKNELIISIVNSGLGGAKLLTLKINEPAGIRIFGSKSIYVGNIASDDFERIEFDVLVREGTSSLISFSIEMVYLDSGNNEKKETKNISIRTYSREEAVELGLVEKSNFSRVIISILILVALFLVYRYLKKRRKKR